MHYSAAFRPGSHGTLRVRYWWCGLESGGLTMIAKMDMEPLDEVRKGSGRVLSVYLDVDQSKAANLNRGFDTAFEARAKEIGRAFEEEYEQRDFEGCVDDV